MKPWRHYHNIVNTGARSNISISCVPPVITRVRIRLDEYFERNRATTVHTLHQQLLEVP